MNLYEKKSLGRHVGHKIVITDYRPGEPDDDFDGGRFCVECETCDDEIILGDRTRIG